jgi:hypothetical protein
MGLKMVAMGVRPLKKYKPDSWLPSKFKTFRFFSCPKDSGMLPAKGNKASEKFRGRHGNATSKNK